MRVRSVKRVLLDEAVPVYDLTVPMTENFALAAGPFVHNSKDCADALAGVLWTLSQQQLSFPVAPVRHSAYALDPWIPEQFSAAAGGNEYAAQSTDVERYTPIPFLRGTGPMGGGNWG